MRPFWVHQAVEYVIGIVLVMQGLQGPEPLVPALAGGLIVLNAACTVGPLSAFRVFDRRTHRLIDIVVIVLLLVAAVQPWVSVDVGSRLILVAIAVVLGFVWFYTDFAERAARRDRRSQVAGNRGEDIGRRVGRLAGGAVTGWRRRQEDRPGE
jgi:hypothetical protein